MMRKERRYSWRGPMALALALGLLSAPAAFAGEAGAEKDPPAAPAKLTGHETLAQLGEIKVPLETVWKIERAQLANARRFNPSLQPQPQQMIQLRRKIAEKEIEIQLLKQYAAEKKLEVADKDLAEWISGFKKQLARQRVTYAGFLKSIVKTEEEFKAISRARLAVEKKIGAEISGETVEAALQQRKDKLALRRCSHILFMYKGSGGRATRSKKEARALAEEALKKIKAGADFGALAEQFSDCPSGKQAKGDLKFISRKGQMVEPFAKAVYELGAVGGVSDVVETQFGFHVIKLTAKKDLKDLQAGVKNQLLWEKFQKFIQQLRAERMKNVKFNEKLLRVGPPAAQG